MTINLQAPVFGGKEEEWPKFIVKFQSFLVTKGCTEVIQTNDEELDVSTKIEKAMKLRKIKNATLMGYGTQYLSSTAMLNAVFNVQAAAGWPTGETCQLFDNVKHKYNPTDKLSRVQMIKKLNEIKPKKGEEFKVMCYKIELLKVEYLDQTEILDNDTIVMHLFWFVPSYKNQN